MCSYNSIKEERKSAPFCQMDMNGTIERSRQYETEQTYFFYKVFFCFYVFFGNPGVGISPVFIEDARGVLLEGDGGAVLADADHFRAVRDLRTYYRVSAQKNDENCGETGMFCG